MLKTLKLPLLALALIFLRTLTANAEADYSSFNVSPKENTMTLDALLKDYIPKPFNAVVLSDSIHVKGKKKKAVMPILLRELQSSGWVEISTERKGELQYFAREIDGNNIKISLVPAERGGPEEVNTSTFIYFRIISNEQ